MKPGGHSDLANLYIKQTKQAYQTEEQRKGSVTPLNTTPPSYELPEYGVPRG